MIAEIQTAITQLVYNEGKVPQHEVDIRFATPTSTWVSGLTRPTLNFFLHDLHENAALRRSEFNQSDVRDGIRRDLVPRRIDLKFMITVFFKSQLEELGQDEWNVLWRVLAALLRQEEWDDIYVPAPAKQMGLGILSSVSQTPNQGLFSNLGLPMRPHLNYTLTVPLSLDITLHSPLLFERRVKLQDGVQDKQLVDEMIRSSWIIRDAHDQPIPNALVLTKQGQRGFTNEQGIVHLNVERSSIQSLQVMTLDGERLEIDAIKASLNREDSIFKLPSTTESNEKGKD